METSLSGVEARGDRVSQISAVGRRLTGTDPSGPRGEGSALYWIGAQLYELLLRRRLYMGKGQSEFLRMAPANCGPFNCNRVNVILRKDPTHELRSDWEED